MGREWNIFGSEDYTITTIPTTISTTSDERIYKGRLFFNKEKLKKTLGLFTVKEKFEYQVKRSNKTCFEAYAKT